MGKGLFSFDICIKGAKGGGMEGGREEWRKGGRDVGKKGGRRKEERGKMKVKEGAKFFLNQRKLEKGEIIS
jgi:hypothetical protein